MRKRRTAQRFGCTFGVLAVLLSACSGVAPSPDVVTTGEVHVEEIEPDVRSCTLTEGAWFALVGENLGSADGWTSGRNSATFPPNPPGVPAEGTQVVGETLYLRVPDGASSGTLTIDVEGAGSAEIPVVIEPAGDFGSGRHVATAVCTSNPPPAS